MACYHPNKVFQIGTKDNGKADLMFCGYSVHHVECDAKGNWQRVYNDFDSNYRHKAVYAYTEVPCGNCIGCRLDYAKAWSERLMIELQTHKSAYFATITYNDAHLPTVAYTSPETGEIGLRIGTLQKRDIQLFIKRLRKNTGQKLRYYCAGEYGSQTLRPHYHMIIFGLELDDLVPYSRNGQGNVLYTSATVQNAWLDTEGVPIGYIILGEVTKESCEYTARYCMKKVDTDQSWYDERGMQREFTLMSTKPGIARGYYDTHPDCLDYEHINLSTAQGGIKVKVPKYFWRVSEEQDPERLKNHKNANKKRAVDSSRAKLEHTSQEYLEYLETEEKARLARIKGLKKRKDL